MTLYQQVKVGKAVLAAHLFGRKTPVACHFSITNRCPWKCKYCGFPFKDKRELTTEQALRIINELADAGNVRLHLVGGEPALREDLGLLAKQAKARGLFVTMATTGFQFRNILDQLQDIDLFFLSFDGPEEIHEAQRGKGSYRVLREAMAVLRDMKKPFWTTTVLTHRNIDQIDFVLNTAKEEGFQANFHLLYYTGTNDTLPNSFHLNQVDDSIKTGNLRYQEALAYLLKRKEGDIADVIASSSSYLKALQAWGDLSEVYRRTPSPRYRCWAGKLYCYIDANGDLFACGDTMGRAAPVNVLDKGFAQAFITLPPLPCESCIVACFNELNLMFSLNAGSILNWARKLWAS